MNSARAFANNWIAAWNAHDLDAILSHYADTLVFRSPLVIARGFGKDGVIQSKDELARYFALGLSQAENLHFALIEVCEGVGQIGLIYRNHRRQMVVEIVELNSDGLVVAASVVYGIRAAV